MGNQRECEWSTEPATCFLVYRIMVDGVADANFVFYVDVWGGLRRFSALKGGSL